MKPSLETGQFSKTSCMEETHAGEQKAMTGHSLPCWGSAQLPEVHIEVNAGERLKCHRRHAVPGENVSADLRTLSPHSLSYKAAGLQCPSLPQCRGSVLRPGGWRLPRSVGPGRGLHRAVSALRHLLSNYQEEIQNGQSTHPKTGSAGQSPGHPALPSLGDD